jgi:LmbE family N-acetylglucosaminyl deacetylase
MSRILVVSPHRDDETIGCGGTICAHTERGDEVAVVHVSGEAGASLAETHAACAVLGVTDISTLPGPAIRLEATLALVTELVAVFRRQRPDIVYVPHADDDDPTHEVTSRAVREARWIAAYPILSEAGAPTRTPARTVYEYEVWTPLRRPSVFVDITPHQERKVRALACYSSQLGANCWVEGALGLNRYRGVTSGRGHYVEAFSAAQVPHVLSAGAGGDHTGRGAGTGTSDIRKGRQ